MTGQVLRLVCPAELGGRLDHCLTAMLTEYSQLEKAARRWSKVTVCWCISPRRLKAA